MNYALVNGKIGCDFQNVSDFLWFPNRLEGFSQSGVDMAVSMDGPTTVMFYGSILSDGERCICPACGNVMYKNKYTDVALRHIPFGGKNSKVVVSHCQYRCRNCDYTENEPIPFKNHSHMMTRELHEYICSLLEIGTFTLSDISRITGVGRNIIRDIDKERLEALYTDGCGNLRKPETYARYIAIDEFLLHHGHQYATVVIDLDTGHVLYIAKGRKKQVVYDFFDYVGDE